MRNVRNSGVKGHPLVGVLPRVRHDPLQFYTQLSQNHGDIVPVRIGPEWLYFVNSREHVKHVFQDNRDNYVKSKHYRRMRFFLGDGMFTTNGDAWTRQRRGAQPAFHGPHLKKIFANMVLATEDMLERWERTAAAGEEMGLCAEAMQVALDVALRSMFGTELSGQASVIYDALNVILPELERRVWAITPLASWFPIKKVSACREAIAAIDHVVEEIILERLKMDDPPEDLLTSLVSAESECWNTESMRRLRDQVVIFLVAGHETTATTLAWAWHSLSKYPLIDRRLSGEVQSVLGPRPVKFPDLEKLVYTRMVFQETLRLYPPGWMLTREALSDDEIGGHRINKGDTVMICAYSMHRNPRYWDNPEGFDPSRFSPDCAKDIDSCVYFPFGGGDRTCIGNRFAMMEAQIILAETVRRYRLELVSGQNIVPQAMITIRPREDIRMRLRPRALVPEEQQILRVA